MPENKYSIDDIYKVVGENSNLCKVLDGFRNRHFPEDNESFVSWWYDQNKGLEGKSPDQLCKEGKQKELEKMLMDILTAAHGG